MSVSIGVAAGPNETEPVVRTIASPIRDQLVADCQAMVQHALSRGQELPPAVIDALALVSELSSPGDLPPLAELHARLSRIVAPATPAGLRMVQEDLRLHRKLHMLGPLPSLRYLTAAALVFSAGFLGLALFPQVSHEAMQRDLYEMSGVDLLIPLLFLLSAAGLGATFGALFEAFQYVSEGRFDAKLDSVYWTRIGLGLVSGLLLAEMISSEATTDGADIRRPLIALLGGFSAAVVHRILQRFVSAIEGVFMPGGSAAPTFAAAASSYPSRVVEEPRLERMIGAAVGQAAGAADGAAIGGDPVSVGDVPAALGYAMEGPAAALAVRPAVAAVVAPAVAEAVAVVAPTPVPNAPAASVAVDPAPPAEAPVPAPDRLLATMGRALAEQPFKRWAALLLHTPLPGGTLPPELVTDTVAHAVLARRPKLSDALDGSTEAGQAVLRALAADGQAGLPDSLAGYAGAAGPDAAAADLRSVLLEVVVMEDVSAVMPPGPEVAAALASAAALSLDGAGAARIDALVMAVTAGRGSGASVDEVLQAADAAQAAAGAPQ